MRKRGEWSDAEVVADLTRELPLARYCLIGGRLHTWARLKQPDGDVWLPLWLLIEDNALAEAAPGAMCRAGVRVFRSAEEAVAWGRAHLGAVAEAEPGAAPDTAIGSALWCSLDPGGAGELFVRPPEGARPMEPQPSRSVAEALADVWSWHRTPRFLDYVADSFGVRVADLAAFDALYIYQVADGDLERGQFDHGSTFQWWEVTDAGVRECGRPGRLLGWRDAPEKVRGSFYRWPYVSFLHCGERVGFGECFGPALLNRKAGQLAAGPGGIELAGVQVVWRG